MADRIYVGKKASSFHTAPRFPGYDMVLINIDDNQYVSSPRVTVNEAAWRSAGLGNGAHAFIYDGTGWKHSGTAVSLASYGITPVFSSVTAAKAGDVITVSQTTEEKDGETTVTVTAMISRTGRRLEQDNPFGTVQMADALLASVYGLSYQPYEAGGAILDPSAELGDAITAYGIYGGLYAQDLTFGRLMASDISAAGEEEIDNEYQYKTPDQRKYARKFADIQSEFTIQASQIAAKVSQVGGDESFSWELEYDHFSVLSGSTEMLRIDGDGATFAGTVRANKILAGTVVIGGQTVNAGHITGGSNGQIAGTTITGSNIAASTITSAKTDFADDLISTVNSHSSYFDGSSVASKMYIGEAHIGDSGNDVFYKGSKLTRVAVYDASGQYRDVLGF